MVAEVGRPPLQVVLGIRRPHIQYARWHVVCGRWRANTRVWTRDHGVFRRRGCLGDVTLPLSRQLVLPPAFHLLLFIAFLLSDSEVIRDSSLSGVSDRPVVLLVEGLERHGEEFGPLLLQCLVHH